MTKEERQTMRTLPALLRDVRVAASVRRVTCAREGVICIYARAGSGPVGCGGGETGIRLHSSCPMVGQDVYSATQGGAVRCVGATGNGRLLYRNASGHVFTLEGGV